MTRNKTHALRLAAALFFCGAALAVSPPAANAQTASSTAPQSKKIIKSHFLVDRMTYQLILVQAPANLRETQTFSYSPQIRDKMQKLFNAGGYQYGDKVTVWYRPGTEIALKIKGKPSKKK